MMKSVVWIVCAIMLFTAELVAQVDQRNKTKPIQPTLLSISDTKTTNLIFPYGIKSVDRGHDGLLVQKASQAENVLQVKAASADFKETNLTVITGDGTLYSFVLQYAKSPSFLNLSVGEADYGGNPVVLFSSSATAEGKLQQAALQIISKKQYLRGSADKKNGIALILYGVYIRNDVMYFQLALENRSNLSYHIEQVRLFVADAKQAKRTASQQIELQPLHVEGNKTVIGSSSKQIVVFAVPKFNIPDKKYLSIQMQEHNGGRHLQLRVRNKNLISAVNI